MRDTIRFFKRLLTKYKGYLTFNIVFNILAALFGTVSILTITPVLEVLLGLKEYEMVEVHFRPISEFRNDVMNNLYAYISQLVDLHGASKALIYIGVTMIILVFLKTAFTFTASFCIAKIRNHTVKDIRNSLYDKVLNLPIGYFSEKRKGDIISRMSGDVQEIEFTIGAPVDMLFKNPFIILFALLSMIFMSLKLTIFVFVLLPVAAGLIGFIGKSLRKHSLRGQVKMGEILSTFEETLSGLRIVKGFNAEKKMYERQKKQNNSYRKIMDNVMTKYFLASPLSEFLGTAVIIILVWYGGSLIITNTSTLTPAQFLTYIALFYLIINPAKNFSTAYYRVQKGLASLERIDEILNTESNIIFKEKAVKIDGFKEKIEYKNVSFKYLEDFVLQDLNLTIHKGQTIALVGQSGSGKSTMVDLLPRFYDVVKGEILIDGLNVKEADISSLRKLFGIVNQEPILFNDTIYNNISFGVNETTQEKVEQAAKIANAHEFILETEHGYDTIIGDRGSRLSGGQRQRISIARAILTNAPVMILDEATSSLDTESEKLVQDAINKLLHNRTSIVIAHRLSTIRNADVIYVLNQGRIIETGNYDDLLKQKGEFKKLHDNQFQ